MHHQVIQKVNYSLSHNEHVCTIFNVIYAFRIGAIVCFVFSCFRDMIRPHHLHAAHGCGLLCLYMCLFIGSRVSCAKTADPMEMHLKANPCGPKESVIRRSPDLTTGKNTFEGLRQDFYARYLPLGLLETEKQNRCAFPAKEN